MNLPAHRTHSVTLRARWVGPEFCGSPRMSLGDSESPTLCLGARPPRVESDVHEGTYGNSDLAAGALTTFR